MFENKKRIISIVLVAALVIGLLFSLVSIFV